MHLQNGLSKVKSNFQIFIGNIKITEISYLHFWNKTKQIITINISKPRPTVKNPSSNISKSLSSNGSTIKASKISNVFYNYFATTAEKTKEHINHSQKHFSDFLLKNRHQNSFFVSPTNESV